MFTGGYDLGFDPMAKCVATAWKHHKAFRLSKYKVSRSNSSYAKGLSSYHHPFRLDHNSQASVVREGPAPAPGALLLELPLASCVVWLPIL